MVAQTVLVERDGGIATVTLNRPERLNAVDAVLAADLEAAVTALGADADVRVVVLTGAGAGFCAGGDLKAVAEAVQAGRDPAPVFAAVTAGLHRTVLALRRMPQPVVACINGATGGIGLSLAAACDLRLAAEEARFKPAYTAVGLSPDGGWTATVARLVGLGRASELLLLDEGFDAAHALALGLVHEVLPTATLAARTRERARQLEEGAAGSFAAAKSLLNAALLPDLEAVLERERATVVARSGTPEFRERLAAFLASQARRRAG